MADAKRLRKTARCSPKRAVPSVIFSAAFIELVETSSFGGTAGEPDPEGSSEPFGREVLEGMFPVVDELENCELPLPCLLVTMRGE